MPVVNVNLVLDEATYAGVKSGALELCGMVKDSDHRIRKHLPTVFDAAKDGASKAIDIVREHKKGAIVVGGILVAGGTVAGIIGHFATKEKRKAEIKLGQSFDAYIEAAKNGTLTVDILDMAFSLGAESGFSWIGEYDITADELLSGTGGNTETKTEQAERLILDLLADGKEMASEDIVKAAAEAGISERTVQNAKRSMGGILGARRVGSQWYNFIKKKQPPETAK